MFAQSHYSVAPTCAEKQLALTLDEVNTPHLQGTARWLAEGLKIQETQYVSCCIPHHAIKLDYRILLAAEVRRHAYTSVEDQLSLSQKRIALDRRISQHHTEAGQYLPAAAVAAFLGSATINVDDGWFDEEDPDEEAAPMPTNGDFNLDNDDRLPESRSILLPSNMSKQDRKAFGLNSLRKKELALRQGQANEALQAIRIGIGEKSFRFRNNLRPANSKGLKTRAWTLINNAGKKLQQHRLLYRQARQAMILLGADHLTRETYKDLTTDDMKTSTAVQQTNASGQRNAELSWIWRMEGIFDGDEDAFVTECVSLWLS